MGATLNRKEGRCFPQADPCAQANWWKHISRLSGELIGSCGNNSKWILLFNLTKALASGSCGVCKILRIVVIVCVRIPSWLGEHGPCGMTRTWTPVGLLCIKSEREKSCETVSVRVTTGVIIASIPIG